MQYLVIGASGLLGQALVHSLSSAGEQVTGTYWSRPRPSATLALDVRDRAAISELIESLRPDVIFLAVRPFTEQPAENPNAETAHWPEMAGSIASAAARVGGQVVSYSSARVFDGVDAPWTETQRPRSLDEVGQLEVAAEGTILTEGSGNLVIRTSEIFGWDREDDNLVMRVWERLEEESEVVVADDELITPTHVGYLAEASIRLVESGESGVFHVTNGEPTSPLAFARKVAHSLDLDGRLVRPPFDDERRTAAGGPGGTLQLGRLLDVLGTPPPTLDAALRAVRRQWLLDTGSLARSTNDGDSDKLRAEILDRVRDFYELAHGDPNSFVPFETRVRYAGRVFGAEEITNLVDSALSFWLTMGPYADQFEAGLRSLFQSCDVAMVSSGSAANLTAVAALTSPQLSDPVRPGDEVITPAATFPTTLAPIVQCGLTPVFVDCEIGTYNVNPELLEEAVSPRTRAIVIPHTLGNPCDMDAVMDVAERHGLMVVEDVCDALGSTFRGRLVGTFGHLATLSFYPAHHITTGEGGAVVVNPPHMARVVRSVRDWGRACWCGPGEDNSCAKRFGWECGDLPRGYDHRFIFSNIGFNFKPTDMQAAVGLAQLGRLDYFNERRKHNFTRLYEGLEDFSDDLILPVRDPRADPAWFGFPITVREGRSRASLVDALERANVETRMIFGGNILRQPAYKDIRHRVSGTLRCTDQVMSDSFFIGVYPGLTDEMIDFVVEQIGRHLRS